MDGKNIYVSASTIVFNNIVDSFNNNTDCKFDNRMSFSNDESGTTKVRKRTNVSNEEFCFVWAKYHLLGLNKICEVLGVTRNWAWFRYLFLTNDYNGVNLPICTGSVPGPVDAETLNTVISEVTPES